MDENPQIIQRLSVFTNQKRVKSNPFQATLDNESKDTITLLYMTKQVPALYLINKWIILHKAQSDDKFMNLADEEYRKMGSLHNLATHRQFLTFREIHKAQINNPISSKIIEKVQRSANNNYKNYTLHQGLLVKLRKTAKKSFGDFKSIFIPGSLIGTALASIHSMGHPGIQTMCLLVRNYYFFKNMKSTIIEFLHGCHICNILNGLSQRRKEKIGNTFVTS